MLCHTFSFVTGMALGVKANQTIKLNQTKTLFMKLLLKTLKGWVFLICLSICLSVLFLRRMLTPTLCVHKAKESWEMDLNEKLGLAAGVKHKGNQYFKVQSRCWVLSLKTICCCFYFKSYFQWLFLLSKYCYHSQVSWLLNDIIFLN